MPDVPAPDVPVFLVRLLPGVVGEVARVVHIVPATYMAQVVMVTLCGQVIWVRQAEPLSEPTGMVCEICAFRARVPGLDAQPPHEVTT
jgi:hypothetical protein